MERTVDIKGDFPVLSNCVYLDNAATTQKPKSVVQEICSYYLNDNSNIHRGMYELSIRSEKKYDAARHVVANFVDAILDQEIIFTKSATESINLVASCLVSMLHQGDEIVVSELEHSSNYFPWLINAKGRELKVRVAKTNNQGHLSTESINSCINKKTKIVAVTAMSNVTGECPDLKKVIESAHAVGAYVLIDASQAIAHEKISVQCLDCDFLCFSGHKVYGPMGIGVLYGKKKLLDHMPPFLYGGGMIRQGKDGYSPVEVPGKFESGSPNVADAVGLAAAIQYLQEHDFASLIEKESNVAEQLQSYLRKIPHVHVYGSNESSPIISFSIEGASSYDAGSWLSQNDISVRCGAMCAFPLMHRLGQSSLIRVSLGIYNDSSDVAKLIEALESFLRMAGL